MAQATREESALQQFYTKEIMPSRPLDIISALASVIQYMKAEGVGVSMGLHLLNSLNRRLNGAVIMGSDSQALIKATENQSPHAGHYILDEIHNAAEKLQAKQDGLLNHEEWAQLTRKGEAWKGHMKGVIDLCLIWV